MGNKNEESNCFRSKRICRFRSGKGTFRKWNRGNCIMQGGHCNNIPQNELVTIEEFELERIEESLIKLENAGADTFFHFCLGWLCRFKKGRYKFAVEKCRMDVGMLKNGKKNWMQKICQCRKYYGIRDNKSGLSGWK